MKTDFLSLWACTLLNCMAVHQYRLVLWTVSLRTDTLMEDAIDERDGLSVSVSHHL